MGLSKILVVEDSAFSRSLIIKQLEQLDYEVLEAVNGRDAWELIKEQDVNMVITGIAFRCIEQFVVLSSSTETIRDYDQLLKRPMPLLSISKC